MKPDSIIIILILTVILNLILIGTIFRLKKTNNLVRKQMKDTDAGKENPDQSMTNPPNPLQDLNSLKIENQELKDQIASLHKENKELKSEIEDLKITIGDLDQMIESGQNGATTESVETVAENNETIYMRPPFEGMFTDAFKSFTSHNTLYKFRLSENKNEAEYEVHNEGYNLKEILEIVESTIKTGCIELNSYSSGTNKIVNVKPGKVKLSNGNWEIIDKAEIRYE